MGLKEQLQKLASEKNSPCVTISMNTHRTHPDNAADSIVLKNLLQEAKDRVLKEFDKREVSPLVEKIETVAEEIDVNYQLESLHIFLSNETKEIIKSSWPSHSTGVHISTSFAIRPIVNEYNLTDSYLIMLLSQSGVQLFEATNETIVHEVSNDDFPFLDIRKGTTPTERETDSKYLDNQVREFLNNVDKALMKVYYKRNQKCVVICTEDNYSRLLQVADKPEVYLGYANINYNNTATHFIAGQAWQLVKEEQKQRKLKSIAELQETLGQGKILTDLQEIYQAAIDGRGELLVVQEDFSQAVVMKDERSFDLVDDPTTSGAIDDITSTIAWEIISKNGRVMFVSPEEGKPLGKIALKVRF